MDGYVRTPRHHPIDLVAVSVSPSSCANCQSYGIISCQRVCNPYVRPSILRFFVCTQICRSPYRIIRTGCRLQVCSVCCVPVEMHAAAAGLLLAALLHLHVPALLILYTGTIRTVRTRNLVACHVWASTVGVWQMRNYSALTLANNMSCPPTVKLTRGVASCVFP
jgi:hypothetical protein